MGRKNLLLKKIFEYSKISWISDLGPEPLKTLVTNIRQSPKNRFDKSREVFERKVIFCEARGQNCPPKITFLLRLFLVS